MPTVYLETTVPSYLAALPSRDLVVAAHQQITHEWWQSARRRFDLFVSETVLAEIAGGDPEAAARRTLIVQGLPVLPLTDDILALIREYDRRLGLTSRGRTDLPHFAFAVAHEMDYLVTWNCQHIANGEVIRRLMEANSELGRWTPLIVTPEELLEVREEGRS